MGEAVKATAAMVVAMGGVAAEQESAERAAMQEQAALAASMVVAVAETLAERAVAARAAAAKVAAKASAQAVAKAASAERVGAASRAVATSGKRGRPEAASEILAAKQETEEAATTGPTVVVWEEALVAAVAGWR